VTSLPLVPVTPGTLSLGVGIAVTGTRTAGFAPVVQSDLSVAWIDVATQAETLLRDQAALLGIYPLTRSVYDEIYLKEGVCAVALCHDDGPSTDFTTTYPYLRDRMIPATFAVHKNAIGSGLTWANIKVMHDHGMEFACHSRTHGSAPADYVTFVDEALTVADEMALTDGTWQQYIDMFVAPGTWASGPYLFDTPSKVDLTDAGNALRSRYSVATAYLVDGAVQQVNQVPALRRIGPTRGTDLSATSNTLAKIKTKVAQARGQGGLLAMGTHMAQIGQGGFNSLATWQSIIDFLVAERDAGRVEFYTMSAAFNLKHNSTGRRNLLQDGSFALDAANNPLAWIQSGGSPVYTLADAPSGGSSLQINSASDVVQLELPAATYRTIRIKFAAKNASAGVASNARLIVRAYDSTFSTIYNSLDLTTGTGSPNPSVWSTLVTDAYQTYECLFRVDARAGGLMIWPYYNNAGGRAGAVRYADFEIYKT
jgi:hypothetical protein